MYTCNRIIHTGLFGKNAKSVFEKLRDCFIAQYAISEQMFTNFSAVKISLSSENEVLIELDTLNLTRYNKTIFSKLQHDILIKEWFAKKLKYIATKDIYYPDKFDVNNNNVVLELGCPVCDVFYICRFLTSHIGCNYPEFFNAKYINARFNPIQVEAEVLRRQQIVKIKQKYSGLIDQYLLEKYNEDAKFKEYLDNKYDALIKKLKVDELAEIVEVNKKYQTLLNMN